jgi:alkyl sulfatase BDS1-like metallo-beta-lactamase superfamily hydrolase
MIRNIISFSLLFTILNVYAETPNTNPSTPTPKDASQFTQDKNKAVLNDLPFNNKKDFDDAKNNLIYELRALSSER